MPFLCPAGMTGQKGGKKLKKYASETEELIEARKQEMESILPGHQTRLEISPNKFVVIRSKNNLPKERRTNHGNK